MDLDLVIVMSTLFVGLPWIILHYITRWKTAATITSDDEVLLEELYQLAKRLDERMETVERLVAADHPEFQPARPPRIGETRREGSQLDELERLIAEKKGEAR